MCDNLRRTLRRAQFAIFALTVMLIIAGRSTAFAFYAVKFSGKCKSNFRGLSSLKRLAFWFPELNHRASDSPAEDLAIGVISPEEKERGETFDTSYNGLDTQYTHLEGATYKDRAEELEAMGGDPFFLADEGVSTGDEAGESSPLDSFPAVGGNGLDSIGVELEPAGRYAPTDGNGPRAEVQEEINVDDWDGWSVEDAYFD